MLAGKPTAVYYLVLCSVLFAILVAVAGMYYILNEKVPWYVKCNKDTSWQLYFNNNQ